MKSSTGLKAREMNANGSTNLSSPKQMISIAQKDKLIS
ncbi:hypothetical protein GMES_1189 [Paraglaciecola mesophila KMM 241]|uniref:Uncharacterized protein n=1 Tax=Paraglaciecola mesophila KMM 241 TaxID=1128912 RepID=K6Z3B3_9ALTE|nr:hypothetical protein GMES_1189 [Paraglaciecola mesophila KMM 241]